MGIARPALRVPERFADVATEADRSVPLIPGFGCDGRMHRGPRALAERLARHEDRQAGANDVPKFADNKERIAFLRGNGRR